jgi:hypothetical protein
MQHITKQDRIETPVSDRKVPSVVGKVIDASGSAGPDV